MNQINSSAMCIIPPYCHISVYRQYKLSVHSNVHYLQMLLLNDLKIDISVLNLFWNLLFRDLYFTEDLKTVM